MHEDERAPLYLFKLHQELEELGTFPRSAIPAAIMLLIGATYVGIGFFRLFRYGDLGFQVWLLVGGGISWGGFLLARHSYRWFRRVRSLKRGIRLIESRQVAHRAAQEEKGVEAMAGSLPTHCDGRGE